MNPVVIDVLIKNSSDVEAIITKIGISNLLACMPHILNILKTVQEADKGK